MVAPRKILVELIERGVIDPENVQKALSVTKVYPTGYDWRVFVDSLLLWLGALAIGVSAIFFIAYNWEAMGRFAKFGMIEILIIAAILSYCRFADHKVLGKISLVVATLCLGALMAFYGQTYQTGADPWQLFYYWALLMLPWAFISRLSAMWIIWLSLLNLSILLYHHTFRGAFGLFFYSEYAVLWSVFVFNTIALYLWEFLSKSLTWLADRWALRLIAVASGVSITSLCLFAIFDNTVSQFAVVVWLIWLVALYGVYRTLKPDLFMLAGGCLSGIVVIITFLGRHILDNTDAGGFLLLSMLVIGLGTGAAIWLRKLNRELQA